MSTFNRQNLMPQHKVAELILASGSRFRRQMLEQAGVAFSVEAAALDEPAARAEMARRKPGMLPGDVAMALAEAKALEVGMRHPEALVIGADQVLALDGTIFGKPADVAAARSQLLTLRGKTHTLPTAVALAQDGRIVWRHLGVVELKMRLFGDGFLAAYLAAAGDVVTETVGGYALDGLGVQLFERVDGDYFTVIGLPLIPLLAELRERGFGLH